ncbi:MAG TPA: DUF2244 domain-containing protein [Methylococcaceae bacterium]|jgi:uncharacterized membrane protein|nr:DUF2244 domain-containing protein [Methylococcaceae bacterium]
MVETGHDAETGERKIVLRPNASLSRKQAAVLVGIMAVVMGSIGGVFASLGGWLVLPFSGAEWLLLVYCLHLSLRSSSLREVITITDALVQVEKGRDKPEQTYRFQRAWVRLNLNRSSIRGCPSRLALRLHGKEIEVGRFLVESERQALARELRTLLGSK